MSRYAVDQRTVTIHAGRGGCMVIDETWATVVELDAARAGSALRAADAKWPGKLHRARLIQSPLRATLSAGERNDIHAMTTKTI